MKITKEFMEAISLTRRGNYEVNVSFDYFEDVVSRYEKYNDTPLQLNPDFQRGHVWNEFQQVQFIEFMLKGGRTTVYLNHPDWMNFTKKSGYLDFVCVDGLQRITSIRKFMRSELKAFGECVSEFEKAIIRRADVIININNLKTRKEVLTWYIDMNTCGTAHTKEELGKVKNLLAEVL